MKILIIRGHASVIHRSEYNTQEEGLAKALIYIGHQCDIVYYGGNNTSKIECVQFDGKLSYNIFWMKGKKIRNFGFYNHKKIDELVDRYEVIQTLEYEQPISLYLLKKYPEKCVLYHGPYECEFNSSYCKISRLFDLVYPERIKQNMYAIAKSKKAKCFLQKKGIKRISIVNVGLDLSRFSLDEFEESRIPHSLLYIGVIEDRRNVKLMIEIMHDLVQNNPDYKLTIIGKGENTYYSECVNLVNALNLTENVEFIGPKQQNEIQQYYKTHEVFLLPSKYEIFGMVLLEAMLFGCIVVTSDNGGSDTLIRDSENGYIVDDFNIHKWVKKIEKASNEKNDKIRNIAKNEVLTDYCWRSIAQKFEDIYRLVLETTK